MKSNILRRVLSTFAIVAALTPALCLFGVSDFCSIVGFVQTFQIPELTFKTFRNHSYQSAVEGNYSNTFFLHGLFYKIRCQTMEVVNLGVSHEGQNQKIAQFKDGTLFQHNYFQLYFNSKTKVSREDVDKSLEAIGTLGKVLASNGVDMVFVMATDKVQFSQKPLAGLLPVCFRKSHAEFQTEYGRLLADYGIPSFDTFSYLTNEAPRHSESMFPYAGTHWNALASSLVVDELLQRLNAYTAKPYAINRFKQVKEAPCEQSRYCDADIGALLNLFYNPYLKKNKCYLPEFASKRFAPNAGSVILFGDSFSWQMKMSMVMAGDFEPDKILQCDKRVPLPNELKALVPDLRLVLFVYMTQNMLRFDKDPRVGGKIIPFCELLESELKSKPHLLMSQRMP